MTEKIEQPSEPAGQAGNPEANASNASSGRRKTTSRRTRTVLDEIAEQEDRLRKETRKITAEAAPAKEAGGDPVKTTLDAEYATLQAKLAALEKFAASGDTTLGQGEAAGPAVAPKAKPEGARGTAAQEAEDFLKKRLFAIMKESLVEERVGGQTVAEQLNAALKRADAEAPEDTDDSDAPDETDAALEETSTEAEIQREEKAELTPRHASGKTSHYARPAEARKTRSIMPFNEDEDADAVPGGAAAGFGEKDFVLGEEAEAPRRSRASTSQAGAFERARTTLWDVFGYLCMGLAALVIILWYAQLLSPR